MMSHKISIIFFLNLIALNVTAREFDWDKFDEATTSNTCSSLKSQCLDYCRNEATSIAMGNLAQTLGGYRGRQTDSKEFRENCTADCKVSSGDCVTRITKAEEEKQEQEATSLATSSRRGEINKIYQSIESTQPDISVVCSANESKLYYATSFTVQVWSKAGVCKRNDIVYSCSDSGGVIRLSDAAYNSIGALNRVSGTFNITSQGREATCTKSSSENFKF